MGAIAPAKPAAVWRELVAAFQQSGLTQQEFARRNGLHAGTLGCWRARVRRERALVPAPAFVEVTVAGAEPPRRLLGFVVELAHVGHRVQVPSGFDAADLQRLVQALT
jgi:transposase-like protein